MSPGRDPEDMGNLVGPLPSLNHIPSDCSMVAARRLPSVVQPSVSVSSHEDSLLVDGNVFSMIVVDVGWKMSLSYFYGNRKVTGC